MSTDRIKQKLGVQKSKESVNTDTLVKISLDNSQQLLPFNDINVSVNVSEVFTKERQTCPFYRIIGTINPLVSNPLFNLSNSDFVDNNSSWSAFNSLIFLDNSYPKDLDITDEGDLTFPNSIVKYLQENDGWFGYQIPEVVNNNGCEYTDMEPKRERFSFLPDMTPYRASTVPQPTKNWELTITYPSDMYSGHPMCIGGLFIVDATSITIATRVMTMFSMPCKHNLIAGDSVKIFGTNGYDGTYSVNSLGEENGDNKAFFFVIDIPPTGTTNQLSRMTKIVNGVDSEYYFRLFKKIGTKTSSVIETDDYETYQPGFALNAFSDTVVQFLFNEDIAVSGLTDNLGRPLSEIYLTVVKTSSNRLFGSVSSGLEVPFIPKLKESDTITYLQDIPVINRIHNGVGNDVPFISAIPLNKNVNISDSTFYGDLVEYNRTTLLEVVLSEVNHRFNTANREIPVALNYIVNPALGTSETISLGPRQEGYYYQAHYQIKVREFSSYVEEGDASIAELPNYATNVDGVRYIWRDLLDIGFSQTEERPLDYPFLNGSHYVYQNLSFTIKRQDPFNQWGIYYGIFPADPIGVPITDRFITKTEDFTNDC